MTQLRDASLDYTSRTNHTELSPQRSVSEKLIAPPFPRLVKHLLSRSNGLYRRSFSYVTCHSSVNNSLLYELCRLLRDVSLSVLCRHDHRSSKSSRLQAALLQLNVPSQSSPAWVTVGSWRRTVEAAGKYCHRRASHVVGYPVPMTCSPGVCSLIFCHSRPPLPVWRSP